MSMSEILTNGFICLPVQTISTDWSSVLQCDCYGAPLNC